jgi:hypothetical protein
MRHTQEYQKILAACTQEGCLLCRLVQENIQRYLEHWKYELFTDVEIRRELRRSRGFCHRHTWQLAQMGASLPLAQSYRDIITDSIEHLQRGSTAAPGLLRRLTTSGTAEQQPCPACRAEERADVRYIHTLRRAILDDEFYLAFSASSGLCLEHFRLASEIKMSDTPGNWSERLNAAQLGCLRRLEEQLNELIRKHDYRFRDEPHGPEMHSWKRAAAIVSGEALLPTKGNNAR